MKPLERAEQEKTVPSFKNRTALELSRGIRLSFQVEGDLTGIVTRFDRLKSRLGIRSRPLKAPVPAKPAPVSSADEARKAISEVENWYHRIEAAPTSPTRALVVARKID